MSLDSNMKLGVEAAGYVRQKVPKSANYKFTSSCITLNGEPLPLHDTTWKSLFKLRDETAPTQPIRDNQGYWEWMKKCVTQVEAKGIGNCGELAAVALVYLKKKGTTETLDYVLILDGVTENEVVPHVVAVIGHGGAARSNMGLPNTWHADAVVCDPWDRVVYPAKDYSFFWTGLKGHSRSPDQLTCILDLRVP